MLGLNLTEDPRAIREAKEEEALAIVTRQLGRRLRQDIPQEITQQLTQLPSLSPPQSRTSSVMVWECLALCRWPSPWAA
jgi:hypothetical protein